MSGVSVSNLANHLKSLNPRDKCLVVGNRKSFDKYRNSLSEFRRFINLIDVDREELHFDSGVKLVIVLGIDVPDTQRIYSACKDFKDRGLPVVFGIEERSLFYSPPNWKSSDLTIAGMFYLADGYIKMLPQRGAYCEFGVFDGRSFSLACHTLKDRCTSFHAFDSFAGIVGATDGESQSFPDGAYYANIETFWHNMRVAGVGGVQIKAVEGAFQDTLKGKTASDYGIGAISIVHIDSDVYEAALLALEFVSSSLLDGALLLFDEFHAFGANNLKGERRALREWLDRHNDVSVEPYRDYTPVAKSFIVHRGGLSN